MKLDAREQAVFDNIALEFSTAFAGLLSRYPKHEPYIANILCDALAGLVAIAALDPQAALTAMAQRLRTSPWEAMKARHYGYSRLGVKDAGGPIPSTLGPSGTVRTGDPRKR